MPRYFAPITPDELQKKIDKAAKGEPEYFLCSLLDQDLKVSFDTENFDCLGDVPEYKSIVGYHTLENGLTFRGYTSGGDWESPVYFIVYWDGKKLRGYVPTEGDPWNTKTHCAYGNDPELDRENVKKRYPEFQNSSRGSINIDFEPEKILQDIQARILPKPVGVPQKKKEDLPPKEKSLGEKIEALTYYGTGDEGIELFRQTCRLCYMMHGIGPSENAEILYIWARGQALDSKQYCDDTDDTEQGHWGY